MTPETPAANSSPGGGGENRNANRNSRRRALRSKRRARKPEEGSEPRSDSRAESRGESKNEGRGPRISHSTAKPVEKSVRENRERRRRRRMRSKQRGATESAPPVVENVLKDLPPLVPAFVYTHVLRPASRDSFEFRTEHFSKVTRKMEDFHIDLSPLYPDGGDEIKGVAYMPPLADSAEFAGEFARAAARASEGNYDIADYEDDYGDDEDDTIEGDTIEDGTPQLSTRLDQPSEKPREKPWEKRRKSHIEASDLDEPDLEDEAVAYDDPDWDAEESEDAARLDGAPADAVVGAVISDDFYENLDDSVVDEYPEEDIDA